MYRKGTLYGVVDLGRKKFAKVFVMPYGLQGAPGEAMSSQKYCIQAKQLQYNNDIHYFLMIFIFFAYPKILHIQRGFGPIAFGYAVIMLKRLQNVKCNLPLSLTGDVLC